MADCRICGEPLASGSRVCAMCGTSVQETSLPMAAVITPPAVPTTSFPTGAAAGQRVCPACGTTYGPEFADSFCSCGVELFSAAQWAKRMGQVPQDVPLPAQPVASPAVRTKPAPQPAPHEPSGPRKPPPGTICLVLYSPDKKPIQYFPLDKDVLLIGRLDAVDGNFPDIDLVAWLDEATARKASRRHALVLRSRASGDFSLRPLVGNTGTQIDADMVPPLCDYPLVPGRRIILGGTIRFKFEVT